MHPQLVAAYAVALQECDRLKTNIVELRERVSAVEQERQVERDQHTKIKVDLSSARDQLQMANDTLNQEIRRQRATQVQLQHKNSDLDFHNRNLEAKIRDHLAELDTAKIYKDKYQIAEEALSQIRKTTEQTYESLKTVNKETNVIDREI